MDRSNRKHLGKETVAIVDRGWYDVVGNGRVDIAAQVKDCLVRTLLYTPMDLDALSEISQPGSYDTLFEVENETTLSAARRHIVDHDRGKTMCLNFASAKNPGGGFLGGSQAQEESLARSSALYASLLTQDGYDETNQPEKEPLIRPTMANRIAKVLAVALQHGYEHLILGAWGCGVFRNDPREIAELFAKALLADERFHNRFATVTFAVLDQTQGEQIIKPFRQQFARGAAQ